MTLSRRRAPLTLLLIGVALLAALLLIPWAVHAQSNSTAPTNLTAEVVDGGIALSWDAPTEDADSVTGYEVLRRRPPLTLLLIGVALLAALLLIPWAVHAQSNSTAPTNLTADVVDGGIALSWDAPTEDADSVTGYEVLRRRPRQEENSLRTYVADTGSATTTYTDTNADLPTPDGLHGGDSRPPVIAIVPVVGSLYPDIGVTTGDLRAVMDDWLAIRLGPRLRGACGRKGSYPLSRVLLTFSRQMPLDKRAFGN